MIIVLLLVLLAIHVVFREGCVSGCLGLILGPFIAMIGLGAVITFLEWIL